MRPKEPAKRKSAAGMSAQALATQRKSRAANPKNANALAQPQNRWQRAIRYTWDRNRGRG